MRVLVSEITNRHPYIMNLYSQSAFDDIDLISFRPRGFISDLFRSNIFHLHWIEKRSRSSRFIITIPRSIFFILTLLLFKIKGGKIVVTAHNLKPHIRQNRLWDYFIFISIMKISDKIITHSDSAFQSLLKLFPIKREKLIVIPLGSSSAHMEKTSLSSEACKAELDLPADKKVVMLIGNLVAYKGIDLFIEIAKLYLTNHKDAVFFIAGKCESQQIKSNLTNMSSKYQGEFIFRDGYLDEDSIILAYEGGDIGLLPFTRITTSASLETYLYYSVPTLTSDIGPLREIGGDYLWYEKSSIPSHWYDKLRRIVQNENLQEKKALIKSGYKPTSWEYIGKRTKEMYRDMIRNHNQLVDG